MTSKDLDVDHPGRFQIQELVEFQLVLAMCVVTLSTEYASLLSVEEPAKFGLDLGGTEGIST